MSSALSSRCISTRALAKAAAPAKQARAGRVATVVASSSSDASPVTFNRRQAFGVGAAIAASMVAKPEAAHAGLFDIDVPGPATPDYFPDTKALLDCMSDMLTGTKIDVAQFKALASDWESKYKFHHYGQDASYILTLKTELAIGNTAGGWSEAKGFFTDGQPFDPNHTTYNPDVLARYIAEAKEYLEGGREGLQPSV